MSRVKRKSAKVTHSMIVCRTEDRVGQEMCLNNAKGNESATNDAGSERWASKQDSDPQEAITKEGKKVSRRMEGKTELEEHPSVGNEGAEWGIREAQFQNSWDGGNDHFDRAKLVG